jgi:translocation and assembly module TamB
VNRSARLAGYIAIGIAAGLLVATVIMVLLTRTDWGMERARRFAVSWLEQRVEGELRIGRVTGPGLLGGVVIHDFAIVDPRGRPFTSMDSLELSYNWRSLLAGRIVLDRMVLYQPRVVIERLHADTLWNFEHIFTPAAPDDDQRSLIMFSDARIVNGIAFIRTPWEPDGPVMPADTARFILEEAPGGLLRTMRFEAINARLSRVIWESPVEKGQLFDIQSLQARGFVWTEPFIIREARGTVTARDSVISFDLPEVVLPSSEAGILGRVVMRSGDNDIDVRVDGRRLVFRDLAWLYPNLPEEGRGSLTLRIQSQPRGILWLAENARLQAPGTNLTGSFGVVTGDTLYFTQVDLRASPLDVRTLEQILPGGLPVEGLLVGTVEVRGPLSSLETKGDLQLAGSGAPSSLSWRGVLDMRNARDPRALRMHADIRHLELSLLAAFNPEIDIPGSVRGSVEGSGRLTALDFRTRLEHTARGGARSSLDGRGRVHGTGPGRRFDLTLLASPVSIHDLAAMVPALEGMQGELRGPVQVIGTVRDFEFDAALATPGGDLELRGRVRDADGVPRVTATARASDFLLHAFRADLPESVVTGVVRADITGKDVAHAAGTVDVRLDSARFAGVPVGRFGADIRLGDGVLTLDSASLLSIAGVGRAHGSIGMTASRSGTIEAAFVSESLRPLDELLHPGRAASGAEPGLAGRLDVRGTFTGWLGTIDIDALLRGESVVYSSVSAARLRAELSGRVGQGVPTLRLLATADSLVLLAHTLPQARFAATHTGDSTSTVLTASSGGQTTVRAQATWRREGDAAGALRIDELRLGGRTPWQLSQPALVAIAGGAARLNRIELARAEGGRLVADGHLAWSETVAGAGSPIDFSAALTGMPFTEFLRVMRSREEGAGSVEATLRVTGTALDPVVEGELSARDVVYGDVRIDQAFAEASYAGLGIDLHAEAQYGGRSILTAGGRVPLDLRLAPIEERRRPEPLRLTITADSLPPALPLGLLEGFSRVGGRIDGTVALSGTTLDPALSGGFTLRNGSADWQVSGVRYRDVQGDFSIERDRMLRIDVRAQAEDPRAKPARALAGGASGGEGSVTGFLDLATLADPGFNLRFTANRAYAAKRRDVEASVSGEILLEGRYSRPEVSGALRVEQGALNVDELYRQYLIVGLELNDPSLLSLVDTSLVAVRPLLAASANPFLRNLQIRNMQVAVGPESWVRSRDMDVEVSGDLNISFDRRDEDLRLLGSLRVERGTYSLYYPPLQSRRFKVREGTIEFPGTPGIDPSMNITAAYRARANNEPLDILAVVSGTLQNPRVRLTSDSQPPISESDLASYLFFGMPTWEVASAGAGGADVRTMAGSALAPSVLGYASSGLQTLVQSAGLLDYVSLTTAEAVPGGRTGPGLSSFLAGTQVEVGRYLGSELFVGYSQRLGAATYDPAVRIEWRFMPEFSLEMFAEDRFARLPGFGMRTEPGLRKVYGFMLFREWGF